MAFELEELPEELTKRRLSDGTVVETRPTGVDGWVTINVIAANGAPMCLIACPVAEAFGETFLQLDRAKAFFEALKKARGY